MVKNETVMAELFILIKGAARPKGRLKQQPLLSPLEVLAKLKAVGFSLQADLQSFFPPSSIFI